jgi:hypothetical protein
MTPLQKTPHQSGSNDTTPTSKLGYTASRAVGNVASRSLTKVQGTNVSELTFLRQQSCVGANLEEDVSKST